jgi:hypothetical protein
MRKKIALFLCFLACGRQLLSAQMKLEAGVGQKGVVVFYHGGLPLPDKCKLIREDAFGKTTEWKMEVASSERDVINNYEGIPDVFRYLLPLSSSAPKEISAALNKANHTDEVKFYEVTSIALASGLAVYDEAGNKDCQYRLVQGENVLVQNTRPTLAGDWSNYTAKSVGQNDQQKNVRLGWFVPESMREMLQGVIIYRGKPFENKFEPLETLRGFQRQGDSLIATVRDTTTHMMGSWHYGIRMINKYGAASAMSDLVLAHNYPPGSRPWFQTFRATGSSSAPQIEVTWKIGNTLRARAVNLYRSRKADGPFDLIYTAAPSDTIYQDPIQDVMEAYFYYLQVEDLAGDTNIVSVTYPAVCEFKPLALPVSRITCDTLGKNIRISWEGNGLGDRGYYIARTEGYDEKTLRIVSPFVPTDKSKILYEYIDKDTTLRGDRYYTYGVISESHGYKQSEIIATASARPNKPLYVPAPASVHIRKDDIGLGAMLTWQHVVSEQYDRHFGYRVYSRKTGSSAAFSEMTNQMILLDTNWLSISKADPTQEYAVRAIDMYGNKSALSIGAGLTDVFENDFGPRYLRSEEIDTNLAELRWNKPANERAASYQIYMTDGESDPIVIGKFDLDTTNYKVTKPAAPNTHYYFIVAIDQEGKSSSASDWVTVN